MSSHSYVLHTIPLQERREEGRMLEEWLYLQPGKWREGEGWRKWGDGIQWDGEEKEGGGNRVEDRE